MKTQTTASGGVGLGRGGRMSRQRKRDAVIRLLRGEDLEILSRALGVPAATLTGWRDTFVAAGEDSLATRSTDGEALETERARRWRPSGSKPNWARCCLSASCWMPRSLPWRPTALWPAGGRGDEPDPLALKWQALWPGPRVPGLARLTRHHLPPSFLLSARTAAATGSGWADAGCGPAGGDPCRPDRQPVSRRRSPEGLGPSARGRPSHVQAPGAAAHAREQPACAVPGRGAPRATHARRHHHPGDGGHDVGHRPDHNHHG